MLPMPEMPDRFLSLYKDLQDRIVRTEEQKELSAVIKSKRIITALRESMHQLRQVVIQEKFVDEKEEIRFFKEFKPLFCSQLIYQIELLRLEITQPPGEPEIGEDAIQSQIERIRRFHQRNRDFYLYYQCGATHLDEFYFLRKNIYKFPCPELCRVEKDPEFSTACDLKVSQIQAFRLLSQYLYQQIRGDSQNHPSKDVIGWTAPKVALAELIYAFHASGVLNNSQIDISKLSNYFSRVFNIELGNVYKIFEEIRLRKKNRTVFLDSLRLNLLRKMDEDDEHAL